jgi:hypothetical protein
LWRRTDQRRRGPDMMQGQSRGKPCGPGADHGGIDFSSFSHDQGLVA